MGDQVDYEAQAAQDKMDYLCQQMLATENITSEWEPIVPQFFTSVAVDPFISTGDFWPPSHRKLIHGAFGSVAQTEYCMLPHGDLGTL